MPTRPAMGSSRAWLRCDQGGPPPRHVDSGATLVLASDLDRPEIRELLFPDIQRWLKGR